MLGRAITIDGASHTIVGVLQKDVGSARAQRRGLHGGALAGATPQGPVLHDGAGRLRPDVSQDAALDALRATNRRLFPIWKSSYQDEKATWGLLDLKDARRRRRRIDAPRRARRRRLRPAHRVRERRQPAHRARPRTQARAGDSGALGASRGRLLQHLVVESARAHGAGAVDRRRAAALPLDPCTYYGGGLHPAHRRNPVLAVADAWLAALRRRAALILLGGFVPALHGSRLQASIAPLRPGGRSTDGRSGGAALAPRAGRGGIRARHAAHRRGRARAGESRPAESRPASASTRAHAHGWSFALRSGLCARGEIARRSGTRRRACGALPGVEAAALADSRPPREAGRRTTSISKITRRRPGRISRCPRGWACRLASSARRLAASSVAGCSTSGRSRRTSSSSIAPGPIASSPARTSSAAGSRTAAARRVRGRPWSASSRTSSGRGSTRPTRRHGLLSLRRSAERVRRPAHGRRRGVRRPTSVRPCTSSIPAWRSPNVATGDELVADALTTPRYLSVLDRHVSRWRRSCCRSSASTA